MTTTEQTTPTDIDAPATGSNTPAVVEEDATGADIALLGEEESWDDVGDGDMAPDETTGVLSLIPLNKKLGGGFTDIETGEAGVKQVDFVWLAKSKSRGAFIEEVDGAVRRKEYDAKNPEGPGCRSFDGITADPKSPVLQNKGDCGTCPARVWNGDTPPLCKEAIEAMVFLPDPHGFGRLARMRFNGIALGPARNYWKSFNERLPKKPPIAYVTHCELVETETDNGPFLAPKFVRVKEFSRAEVNPLIAERDRRMEEWRTAVATDVSTGVAGDAGEGTDRSREPFPDEPPVDEPPSGRPIHQDDVAGRFGASEETF